MKWHIPVKCSFCFSSQIHKHLGLVKSIAGKNENLLINQEAEGTYHIDLH